MQDTVAQQGTDAPFGTFAGTLLRLGYSGMPLDYATKKPALKGWASRLWLNPLTLTEIDAHARRVYRAGVGVAGGYRNLISIDIDSDDEEIVAAVLRVLPPPLTIRRGRRGVVLFYRVVAGGPLATRHLLGRDGLGLVDIIGTKGMTVLPPSRHKDGDFYRWASAATLFNTPVTDLPELPANLYDVLADALAPWRRIRRAPAPATVSTIADPDLKDPRIQFRYKRMAESIFERHKRELAQMGQGGRNHAVFNMARELGWALHRELIGSKEVEAAAIAGSLANGWLVDVGEAGVIEVVGRAINLTRNDPLPPLRERPR